MKTVSMLNPETKVEIITEDITQSENLEAIIADKVSILGKISGFIHCAGIEKRYQKKKHNAQLYQDIFAVNVIAGLEIAKFYL